MKTILTPIVLLAGILTFAQTEKDTIKSKEKEIEGVTVTVRKPTVESKVDRTVFNVSNSSILAGNTTWDVLRMTPLVSIDNNDAIKAEGESVTVYINDRKSVFTGKELKEYLKTIPADNLMKIEVITSPSSRYEATGSVINIVLKKRDDEGLKGSVTLNNRQNTKNSQYTNLNLNYHKKNFTQTLIGSYSDNTNVQKDSSFYSWYADSSTNQIDSYNISRSKNPSLSSTSEFEIDNKNTIGLILEYYQSNYTSDAEANGSDYLNNVFKSSFDQNQNSNGLNRNLGTNIFYKWYDKEKNRILDVNLGSNYYGQSEDSYFIRNILSASEGPSNQNLGVLTDTENRNYYAKIDYTQPLGKSGGNFEVGAKINFNNNVVPNNLYGNMLSGLSDHDIFHYEDNITSVYANYSRTFFKKLETRIGLRYEYIDYKMRQDIAGASRKDSYGNFLPNILLKYTFSDKYDLSLTYNRNLWRPWYAEFNPFMTPNSNGIYSRGNIDLNPNPSDRLYMKLGILKKYFISARYMYTDQDYWTDYLQEEIPDGTKTKTINITQPSNFNGKVHKYYLYANTNQTFFKNKFTVNLGLGWYYIDNSDFNAKNKIEGNAYISYLSASTNLSYTNLFNKNINVSAWVEVSNQNNGNSTTNKANVFHNISVTKIFPKTQMEVSLQLMNIFQRPNYDATTYNQQGFKRSVSTWDWYGASISFVKRFGNQKVKENTKTDVEKNGGGGK
ncbi:Outer membrane receptor proteins, mostly Fe transport [Chryseobacterium taeanense]|uniref:Outer membrane receptor proteins, mostly Fe transport n=1 Tax=Chryseobacterium taeanense TaxID=311334 RepID=A0A1G8FQB9_9FLAO|nr:outer membrane beta-barrel protein [Chryseobacterium taeanense]SDH84126.1 Outer membrane receptor proteins, mostly Fe transport [Chryseobacterium taeanense]